MACGNKTVNRINPLHIAGLLMVVLLFFVIKLSSAKEELIDTKELYQETLSLSTQLKGLSEVYSNKSEIRKSLKIVLKNPVLTSSSIEQKSSTSSMILSSESMNHTALNFLMGKLLNGSYNIVSLKIKRLSEKNASLEVEIKW